MPITNAQARRLLAACVLTYPADGWSPTALAQKWQDAGYLAPCQVFNGAAGGVVQAQLVGQIDQATLGVTANEIVVAFRGTLPPGYAQHGMVAADWLNNARAGQVPLPGAAGVAMHSGFYASVMSLWSALSPAIAQAVAAHPALPLCFTGHSKGGAMAQIAALIHQAPAAGRPLVCTFAAARAGNAAFAAAFDVAAADSRRYEYGADIVPHLPPASGEVIGLIGLGVQLAATAAYVSAGGLRYLPMLGKGPGGVGLKPPPANAAPITDQAAADVAVKAAIEACNAAQIADSFLSLAHGGDVRPWFADQHSIGPGSGYDLWVR